MMVTYHRDNHEFSRGLSINQSLNSKSIYSSELVPGIGNIYVLEVMTWPMWL